MNTDPRVVPISATRRNCEECSLIDQCLARDELSGDDQRYDVPVSTRVLHRGEHLFRAGERFESLYMIRSGAVKTYLISASGEEQVIGFHFPGELVGVDAIEHGVYASHAQVLDTSSVCVFAYQKLLRLCQHSSRIQERFLQGLSRRISRGEHLLLLLGQKTAEQRVATLLLDLSRTYQDRGLSGSTFTLPMSRVEIGSYLGLAVETVSRVLTRLQNAGAIVVQRNEMQIADYDCLLELAEGPQEIEPIAQHSRR